MNTMNDREFDERLRAAVAGQVPSEVDTRLRLELARLRERTLAASPPRRLAARGWWQLGLSAAAVVAIAAAIGLLWRPQTSLAEVADAVKRQPWVHVQTKSPSGRNAEIWYSLTQQIVAHRTDNTIEYRDHRRSAFDSYDTKEKILYRLPKWDDKRANQYAAMATAMSALLQFGKPVEKPLEQLDFLGRDREKMRLVSQEVAKLTEDGRQWLEYRMQVTHPELKEPMTITFRVDADTKLPRLCRLAGLRDGKPISDETHFDYPETGPADVYALGVPKDAEVVDRVPKDDVKRILAALEAGRERMDSYRAVFVNHNVPADYSWWYDLPNVWYRKGDKFRADYIARWTGDLKTEPPAADADLADWWRKRAEFFHWYPRYVLVGSKRYTSQVTKDNSAIEKVHVYEDNSPLGNWFPPEYSMRPEFACRPPMGIGAKDQDVTLDLQPKDGPAGCVLLKVRHTSDEGRVDGKGVGLVDESRFWLDPERDYIVMRWDWLMRNDAGELEPYNTTTTEEVARSPGGVWYATKMRREPHHKTPDGQPVTGDTYHIYVDFNVKLDDAMFNPPRIGKIE